MSDQEVHAFLQKKYIEQQLAKPETHQLEFKSAATRFDSEKAARYCIAIANSGGGHMYLGIADKMPRTVTGTKAFRNIESIEKWLSDKTNLKIRVKEYWYDTKRVVELEIPSRPHGRPLELDGTFWTRTGESLTGMTADEIAGIIKESQIDFELEVASTSLTAQEVLQMLDVRALFNLLEKPLPHGVEMQMRELLGLGLIKKSSIPGEWMVLNIGALMIAHDLADFDLRIHKLRVIQYAATGRINSTMDRVYDQGYAIAIPEAIAMLTSMLPKHEDFSRAHRTEVSTYPLLALREFIANAIVHQDFRETGGGNYPTVEAFQDRIEISNAGVPLIEVKKFVTEVAQRNRILSDMMRRVGLAENRGSGIDRSLAAIEEIQGATPEFLTESYMTRVIMRGSQSWEQMGPQARRWTAYMHCCLKWVEGEQMTNATLRQRFGLSDSKTQIISNLIRDLVQEQIIMIDPKGPTGPKGRRYIPYMES